MDSLIFTIAESIGIPDFLFKLPNFYENFSNWYFITFHYWEYIPDDPVIQETSVIDYSSDLDSEIEWYLSDGTTVPFKENKVNQNIDNLFDYSDNISDTGSDYSLYWYNSD